MRPAVLRRSTERADLATSAKSKRFVILVSDFHAEYSRALLAGAVKVLQQYGASKIWVVHVPGAFELPIAAVHAARMRPRPHALIALGAILRGQTSQYAVLAQTVMQGLCDVSVRTGIVVNCGVVVAETRSQAKARSGGGVGNRGEEAALAALNTLRGIESLKRST